MKNFEQELDLDHEENVQALNIEGSVIHISQATSGRKGYYCQSCQGEMEAYKSNIRKSHFRHVATDILYLTKCTWSSETYRHAVAKEILQRIKKIKVPALYKYDPEGRLLPNRIKKECFIEASTIKIELSFYENDDGEVKWGKVSEGDNRHLIIKPDVTFFNANNEPILLIEFFATHKVPDDKKVKLKFLGIDCVEVKIPKESAEHIEKAFSNTSATKWLYNYEQETTEYIRVSNPDTAPLPSTDEDQRRIFEETLSCRRAEINNVIRSINKCLESELYRTIDERLRKELHRVETNTKRESEQFRGLQEQHKKTILSEFEMEFKQIENSRRDVAKRYSDLENRYLKKRSELEDSENGIRAKLESTRDEIERISKSIGERRNEIIDEEGRIEKRLGEIRIEEEGLSRSIEGINEEERNWTFGLERDKDEESRSHSENVRREEQKSAELEDRYSRIRETITKRRTAVSETFEQLTSQERQRYSLEIERIGQNIARIRDAENELGEIFGRKRDESKRKFDEDRERLVRAVEERDLERIGRLKAEYKIVVERLALLKDIMDADKYKRKLEKARAFVRSGAFKNWI